MNSSVSPSPSSSIQSPSKAYTGSNGSIITVVSNTSSVYSPAISSHAYSNAPSPNTPSSLEVNSPSPSFSGSVGGSSPQMGWTNTSCSGDNHFTPKPANEQLQCEGGSLPKTPSPVSCTSAHLPSGCSGMGTELRTMTDNNSITPASSDQVQDSHISNFIPQEHFNDFNSAILPDFNFPSSNSPPQSNVFLDSVPDIDFAMLGSGPFNPSINHSSGNVLQKLLSEIIELNDDPDFNSEASDQKGTSHVNSASTASRSHAKLMVNSSASTPFSGTHNIRY